MLKKRLIPFLILAAAVGIFFYKVFLGFVPFPGDLLIAEYNPWKSYSYLGYNPGSFPNKAQYFDVLRQIYPWKTLSVELIKSGIVPLWNPYNFSGTPLLANFQSAVFYPLGLLYFILPQKFAWTMLVMLQPLLAAFFTYLYTRKIGIGILGSLFSAISYGFSSFMTVWLEYNTIGHVILWFPLSLLSVEMLLVKTTVRWIALFVLSLVFALLAGHPQIFTYSLIFIAAYIVYRARIRFILFYFFLILLSIGLGAVQIVPGLELIRESARIPHDHTFLMEKILIQFKQLIMLVVPDFFGNPATRNYWLNDTYIGKVTYIGIISLFFVFFSFKNLKKSYVVFFAGAAAAILIFTTSNPFTAFLYSFTIPFISTSAPTLSIFLLCFCLSVLAGFGVDLYIKEKKPKTMIPWLLPIIGIIILLWIIVFFVPQVISSRLSENFVIVYRNLGYATVLLVTGAFLLGVGLFKKKLVYIVLIMLLVIQTGDLFRNFGKFNPFVPSSLVFPNAGVLDFLKKEAGINRFWGYGHAGTEANFATEYSLFSPDGYDPLYPKQYGSFVHSSSQGIIGKPTAITRSDAFIAPGFGETDLSENTSRLKVLDMLSVKYILDRVENSSTEKTFPPESFSLLYDKDGWKIFENKRAAARAFLATDYKVFETNREFEKIFFAKDFDPSKTILLEKEPAKKPEQGAKGNLKPLSYSPNKVSFETNTDGNMLLFISDTYYPGWKAFVNGEEQEIYRANYAFRALSIPKGSHVVSFTFDPLSFKIGLLTTAGAAALFMFCLLYRRKSRFHE